MEPNTGPKYGKALRAAALAFIAVYFAVSAFDGLSAYFTQDDGGNLLNMHKYWETSLASVVGAALRVVTPVYRPLGGIYYLAMYRLAGFHPMPFRAVCLALMLVNLFLAFTVFRRLDCSPVEALFGTVLITNHPALLWLYYSSGTIYEILCFLFYFLAVRCYLDWRQSRRQMGLDTLSVTQLAMLLALAAGALDSKEMAMTLPATLLLVEVFYFPPRPLDWRNVARFIGVQCRAVFATALLTAAVISAKTLTRNPLSNDPRYRIRSLGAVLETMGAYHGHLLYRDLISGGLSLGALVLLWTAMALAAIALRSRAMMFGLAFVVVSLVPVSVIQPRGGYMLYLPLFGWALYVTTLLGKLSAAFIRQEGFRPQKSGAVVGLIFATAIVLTVGAHATVVAPNGPGVREEQALVRRTIQQLQELEPRLEPASSLLLVNDPAPPGFGLLFLTQVAYGDPTITMNRIQAPGPVAGEDPAYDHVLYYGGGRPRDLTPPPIHVQFLPARAHAGESYTVLIPDRANQTLDATIRVVRGVKSFRATVPEWCTLDSSGRATLAVPAGLEPESIYVRHLRTAGGTWLRAEGLLEVTR